MQIIFGAVKVTLCDFAVVCYLYKLWSIETTGKLTCYNSFAHY